MKPKEAIEKIGLTLFTVHGIAYNGYTYFEQELKTLKKLVENHEELIKDYNELQDYL